MDYINISWLCIKECNQWNSLPPPLHQTSILNCYFIILSYCCHVLSDGQAQKSCTQPVKFNLKNPSIWSEKSNLISFATPTRHKFFCLFLPTPKKRPTKIPQRETKPDILNHAPNVSFRTVSNYWKEGKGQKVTAGIIWKCQFEQRCCAGRSDQKELTVFIMGGKKKKRRPDWFLGSVLRF